jgi:hypothetical protein
MINHIINPLTKYKYSVYSNDGIHILKEYIKSYQSGGSKLSPNTRDNVRQMSKLMSKKRTYGNAKATRTIAQMLQKLNTDKDEPNTPTTTTTTTNADADTIMLYVEAIGSGQQLLEQPIKIDRTVIDTIDKLKDVLHKQLNVPKKDLILFKNQDSEQELTLGEFIKLDKHDTIVRSIDKFILPDVEDIWRGNTSSGLFN